MEEFPLCSTVSNAAARADSAPNVSNLTLSHLHDDQLDTNNTKGSALKLYRSEAS